MIHLFQEFVKVEPTTCHINIPVTGTQAFLHWLLCPKDVNLFIFKFTAKNESTQVVNLELRFEKSIDLLIVLIF